MNKQKLLASINSKLEWCNTHSNDTVKWRNNMHQCAQQIATLYGYYSLTERERITISNKATILLQGGNYDN